MKGQYDKIINKHSIPFPDIKSDRVLFWKDVVTHLKYVFDMMVRYSSNARSLSFSFFCDLFLKPRGVATYKFTEGVRNYSISLGIQWIEELSLGMISISDKLIQHAVEQGYTNTKSNRHFITKSGVYGFDIMLLK